jgi:hypothetical protein
VATGHSPRVGLSPTGFAASFAARGLTPPSECALPGAPNEKARRVAGFFVSLPLFYRIRGNCRPGILWRSEDSPVSAVLLGTLLSFRLGRGPGCWLGLRVCLRRGLSCWGRLWLWRRLRSRLYRRGRPRGWFCFRRRFCCRSRLGWGRRFRSRLYLRCRLRSRLCLRRRFRCRSRPGCGCWSRCRRRFGCRLRFSSRLRYRASFGRSERSRRGAARRNCAGKVRRRCCRLR